MKKSIYIKYLLFILIISVFVSCNAIKQITQTVTGIQKLQFKLGSVDNFNLAGISLKDKSNLKNFSISDAFSLTQAYSSNKLPADFTLNMEVHNPNSGADNFKRIDASLIFDWTLLIDDIPTINGQVTSPVNIPGNGKSTVVPLKMGLDLIQFFKNKSYDHVINLALALGGANTSSSRLKLQIKPKVNTPLGAIAYPDQITVIDKEFR